MRISMVDLSTQHRALEPAIGEAVRGVLASGRYIGGEPMERFETALAEMLEVAHVVGCASGTDALKLSLMALEIGPGDEVITTPFTFAAPVEAIALVGARPVFADINPETFALDPDRASEAVGPRTRAMIPVHLFGQPADLGALCELARAHGLALVEDAAQALGARHRGRPVGGWGHLGCLSFFPTKMVGACGDGGAVATNDAELAERVRQLGHHGERSRYEHIRVGFNSRLDALQAAILSVKLKSLDAWIEARRVRACVYEELLGPLGVGVPRSTHERDHVYNYYVIRVPDGGRDALAAHLAEGGIETAVYYPTPLHLQPAYRHLGYGPGDFPVAEAATREVLTLPVAPEIPIEAVREVAETIAAFFVEHGLRTLAQMEDS